MSVATVKVMETIFTLLLIILPIVFKLIGKKLEQAGHQPADAHEPVEDWVEVLRRHVESQAHDAPVPQESPVQQVMREPGGEQQTAVRNIKPVKPAAKVSKPILNEESEKVGEKIDKKKLILYSEIMKPKYDQ